MRFYVIYEFDIPMGRSVRELTPTQRHLFDLTEQSDGEESDWCGDLWDGKVKHRKYCGDLDKKQFERFLQDTGIYPEDVETMGSLTEMGLLPAVSFRGDEQDSIQSAYVTPYLEWKKTPADERDWQRVRKAVLSTYR